MQQTGSGSQAAPTPSGTTITWSELEAAFAPERLAPYLNHSGGDRDRAVALYLWNIALCESLYPLLNLSEITLRNRFHQVLSQHFQRLCQHRPQLTAFHRFEMSGFQRNAAWLPRP